MTPDKNTFLVRVNPVARLEHLIDQGEFLRTHPVISHRNFANRDCKYTEPTDVLLRLWTPRIVTGPDAIFPEFQRKNTRPATVREFLRLLIENPEFGLDERFCTLRSPGGIYSKSFVVAEVGYDRLVTRSGRSLTLLEPGPDFFLDTILVTTDI